jgi:hypothetical protein
MGILKSQYVRAARGHDEPGDVLLEEYPRHHRSRRVTGAQRDDFHRRNLPVVLRLGPIRSNVQYHRVT